MPLDTGGIIDLQSAAEQRRDSQRLETYAPDLQSGRDIGQALQAIREFKGLTLEAVADTTRVRRAYLMAIEAMQLEKLPSRPFTIGYIRAYAQALGLDGEAAVDRFRAEEPALDDSLHEPLGVRNDHDPRMAAILVVVVMILVAIVVWNVAQRAMNESAPPSATAPAKAAAQALAAEKAGPVSLGAPLPAPVESTTPPPYETPGLADAAPDGSNSSKPKAIGVKADGEAMVDPATLPQVFAAEGAVYGAAPHEPSAVTLKARKSASLIVRGPDGSAYFARQLGAGEAYRAPMLDGLTAEVSEPDNVQVFVGGRSKGVLPATHVALGALAAQ